MTCDPENPATYEQCLADCSSPPEDGSGQCALPDFNEEDIIGAIQDLCAQNPGSDASCEEQVLAAYCEATPYDPSDQCRQYGLSPSDNLLVNGGIEGPYADVTAADSPDCEDSHVECHIGDGWRVVYPAGKAEIAQGEGGSQAANLAVPGAEERAWSVFGSLRTDARPDVPLIDADLLEYRYRTTGGQEALDKLKIQIFMLLDSDADGERDTCVIGTRHNDIQASSVYSTDSFGHDSQFRLDRGRRELPPQIWCAPDGDYGDVSWRELQQLYPQANVSSVALQVVDQQSGGARTADTPVYVDNLVLSTVARSPSNSEFGDAAQPGDSIRLKRFSEDASGDFARAESGVAGASVDYVLEPPRAITAGSVDFEWRSLNCGDSPGSRFQPRAQIARTNPDDGSTEYERRGQYQEADFGSNWTPFNWGNAYVESDATDESWTAHTLSAISDDIADCTNVDIRCVEFRDSTGLLGRAYWDDAVCGTP